MLDVFAKFHFFCCRFPGKLLFCLASVCKQHLGKWWSQLDTFGITLKGIHPINCNLLQFHINGLPSPGTSRCELWWATHLRGPVPVPVRGSCLSPSAIPFSVS